MNNLEDLLIKAVHSDNDAIEFFLSNLGNENLFEDLLKIVETSDSGDARMEAAYFISKYEERIIQSAEKRLLILMDDEWNSVAVHIMIALSRIKSASALNKIINNRIKPHLYWEAVALENYFIGDIKKKTSD